MKNIYLLLGSNRGDRVGYLDQAALLIDRQAGTVIATSATYETAPWGFDDPTPFLNRALEIDTELSPQELLEKLLSIERELGRIRPSEGGCHIPDLSGAILTPSSNGSNSTALFATPGSNSGGEALQPYSGRTIDIDILFYGSKTLFTESLMVPHPRLHQRRFALLPLAGIAPEFVHPLLHKTVTQLLEQCTDRGDCLEIKN